tara:strand:- start:41 stop:244 length:204 start_codon:yes stop_codon:yes gene_type:complete
LIATLTAVLGFSLFEVSRMTIGQAIEYTRVMPDVLPYINPYAKRPEKPLEGDAAVLALRTLGIKGSN